MQNLAFPTSAIPEILGVKIENGPCDSGVFCHL